MLSQVKLKNFGPLVDIDWTGLGKINLVIGDNGSGKSFLLKALYCAMRTVEEHKRGNDPRTVPEILAEKLYWTFQVEKLGDLTTKGAEDALSCSVEFDGEKFDYSFGKNTSKQILSLKNDIPPRNSNSIFLPAKEVLSLHHIILKSREQDKSFGFDDTYLDLARALQLPIYTSRGRNYMKFAESRKSLEGMLGGKVEFDDTSGRWQFKKGNQKFLVGVTAEGIKKIAILDILLANRYLDRSSIIFIDEPESALHPTAVSKLLDIIAILSESGIQFFLASHSYFVVKKLYLIALEKDISIPILSAEEGKWRYDDLRNGMFSNPIIDESIRLYKEEMEFALK